MISDHSQKISDDRLEELRIFEEQICYIFDDVSLLEIALTHKSLCEKQLFNKSRQVILGDSLLRSIVALELYYKYPNFQPKELTEVLSLVMSNKLMAKLFDELNMGRFYCHDITGFGKDLPRSFKIPAFKSLVAAIYIDGSEDHARNFVLSAVNVNDKIEEAFVYNSKNYLQSLTQSEWKTRPVYKVETKPNGKSIEDFTVSVSVRTSKKGELKEVAQGGGRTVKAAEKQAARKAFKMLKTPRES